MGRLPPFMRPGFLLVLLTICVVPLLSIPITSVFHPSYELKIQYSTDDSFSLTVDNPTYNITLHWLIERVEISSIETNDTPISIRAFDESRRTFILMHNVSSLENASLVLQNRDLTILEFARENMDAEVAISTTVTYYMIIPPTAIQAIPFWLPLTIAAIIVAYGLVHLERDRVSVVKGDDGSYQHRENWPRYRGPTMLALYLVVAYTLILPGVFATMSPYQYHSMFGGYIPSHSSFFPEPLLIHSQTYNISLTEATPTSTITLYNDTNPITSPILVEVDSIDTGNESVSLRVTSRGTTLADLRTVSTDSDYGPFGLNITASVCEMTVSRIDSDVTVTFSVSVFMYEPVSSIRTVILTSCIILGLGFIAVVVYWDIKIEKIFADL